MMKVPTIEIGCLTTYNTKRKDRLKEDVLIIEQALSFRRAIAPNYFEDCRNSNFSEFAKDYDLTRYNLCYSANSTTSLPFLKAGDLYRLQG